MMLLEKLKELVEKEKYGDWEVKQWKEHKDPIIYGGNKSEVDGLGKVAIATVFVTDYSDLSRAELIAGLFNNAKALIELYEAVKRYKNSDMQDQDAADNLYAALAKLEVEQDV